MLDRLFKRRSRGVDSGQTKPASDHVVMASLQELINLHLQARPVKHIGKRPARRPLSGNHESRFKGRGMDYLESREYQAGDDIRNMDWRVTARSGKPHIKLFQEERERPVLILTDLSAGMFFASRGRLKSVIAAQAAALLSWSALRHGDRVGGMLINHGHIELPPHPGKKAVLQYLNQLVEHGRFDKTALETINSHAMQYGLQRLNWLAHPGSLIFIISDFLQLDPQCEKQLQNLRRHNDCVLVRISDPLEIKPPPANIYRISDGIHIQDLNTRDSRQAEHYQTQFQQRRLQLDDLAKKSRMPLIELVTDEDPVAAIQQFLSGNTLFNSRAGALR